MRQERARRAADSAGQHSRFDLRRRGCECEDLYQGRLRDGMGKLCMTVGWKALRLQRKESDYASRCGGSAACSSNGLEISFRPDLRSMTAVCKCRLAAGVAEAGDEPELDNAALMSLTTRSREAG